MLPSGGNDNVARLQSSFFRRRLGDDFHDPRPASASSPRIPAYPAFSGTRPIFSDSSTRNTCCGFWREIADPDPPQVAGRQALRDFLVGRTTVFRQVDARSGAMLLGGIVAVEPVALPLVGCHQQRVRILRIHLHIDHARLVVDIQDLLPRRPRIGRLVKTAFLVRSPQSSQAPT